MQRLDQEFPFWLFFLTKQGLGLQCIMYCMLPIYTKGAPPPREVQVAWGKLLEDRWLPAMNHMCERVGYTTEEVMKLTDRVFEYSRRGPVTSLED